MPTRESQTTSKGTTTATTSSATTMTCDDHEYDEYCPEQYDAHHHHHHGSASQVQQQCDRERERERDRDRDREREREKERERERERERDRESHHRHSSSRGNAAASALKHQRAATFDVADARDYELQRLGNRRSQQQQQLQQQLQQASSGGGGGVKFRSSEHRGERTHDRERSRSDHRIATYACDDTALCGNSTSGHQHHLANGGVSQSSRQQRREKTFKV